MNDVLTKLMEVLEQRKQANPDSSYVASLYSQGIDAILKKVEEEASEVVDAATSGDKDQIVYEIADLWFHTLVLLAQQDLEAKNVLQELDRRFGISGLDEKASRTS